MSKWKEPRYMSLVGKRGFEGLADMVSEVELSDDALWLNLARGWEMFPPLEAYGHQSQSLLSAGVWPLVQRLAADGRLFWRSAVISPRPADLFYPGWIRSLRKEYIQLSGLTVLRLRCVSYSAVAGLTASLSTTANAAAPPEAYWLR
ncbi:MAG: hypothetical protein ACREDR_29575 [Blastocatellia bacterium]